jgi:hypothetical protein
MNNSHIYPNINLGVNYHTKNGFFRNLVSSLVFSFTLKCSQKMMFVLLFQNIDYKQNKTTGYDHFQELLRIVAYA